MLIAGQQESVSKVLTVKEYFSFLNTHAATDLLHLYDEKMRTDVSNCFMIREGIPGAYQYNFFLEDADKPIVFVSANDVLSYFHLIDQTSFTFDFHGRDQDLELKSNQIHFSYIAFFPEERKTVGGLSASLSEVIGEMICIMCSSQLKLTPDNLIIPIEEARRNCTPLESELEGSLPKELSNINPTGLKSVLRQQTVTTENASTGLREQEKKQVRFTFSEEEEAENEARLIKNEFEQVQKVVLEELIEDYNKAFTLYKQILEKLPEDAERKSELNSSAYLELKEKLWKPFLLVKENPFLQKNESLQFFAENIRELIKVAASTTNLNQIKPFKTDVDRITRNLGFFSERREFLNSFKIPERFGYIDNTDLETQIFLEKVEGEIVDLSKIKNYFNSDVSSIYLSFKNQQFSRARRLLALAQRSKAIITEKRKEVPRRPAFSRDEFNLKEVLLEQEEEAEDTIKQGIRDVERWRRASQKYIKKNLLPKTLNQLKMGFSIAEETKEFFEKRRLDYIFERSEKQVTSVKKENLNHEESFLETSLLTENEQTCLAHERSYIQKYLNNFLRAKHEFQFLFCLQQEKAKEFCSNDKVAKILEEEKQAELNIIKTEQARDWFARWTCRDQKIKPLSKDYDRLIGFAKSVMTQTSAEEEKLKKQQEYVKSKLDLLAKKMNERHQCLVEEITKGSERPLLLKELFKMYEEEFFRIREMITSELFYFSGIESESLNCDEVSFLKNLIRAF